MGWDKTGAVNNFCEVTVEYWALTLTLVELKTENINMPAFTPHLTEKGKFCPKGTQKYLPLSPTLHTPVFFFLSICKLKTSFHTLSLYILTEEDSLKL